jgi:hypothetical protein
MKRKPIHTVRSVWSQVESPLPPGLDAEMFIRNCHDGTLAVIVACEPEIGWHMSISHRGHREENSRYPQWDEIADARDNFLPADRGFVMHLPAEDEYVAVHPTTFHLHEDPVPRLLEEIANLHAEVADLVKTLSTPNLFGGPG